MAVEMLGEFSAFSFRDDVGNDILFRLICFRGCFDFAEAPAVPVEVFGCLTYKFSAVPSIGASSCCGVGPS